MENFKKKFIVIILSIFTLGNINAEDYSVSGIYYEVLESEALELYHYYEYDDKYYIKSNLDEGEWKIEVIDVINSRFLKVKINNIKAYFYVMLTYPSFVFKGQEGKLYYSKVYESTLILI